VAPERLGHLLPGRSPYWSHRVRYHDISRFDFVELWESTEAMRGFLETIEAAAHDWDGREPVRRLAL
jgi:hypothetical protein